MAKVVPVLNAPEYSSNQHANNLLVDEKENVNKQKASDKGGNSSKYRIAKLKRDHPDIAERMIAVTLIK
ncbi:MAG: hypothetical protein Q8Q50_09230 [Methylobacter sp.]|nr:hypothetical protein [Methylobacter sp.]